jgi:hypothetical protein
MQRSFLTLLIGLCICAGCATLDESRNRPFTPAWEQQQRGDQELKRRQERIRGQREGGVLRTDERGRPRLGVGGDSGITGSVGVDRGGSGQVGYRHRWDFVKPPRRVD